MEPLMQDAFELDTAALLSELMERDARRYPRPLRTEEEGE